MQNKYCQNCRENTKQIFVESIWRCEECFNTHSEFLPHPESLLHEIKLEGSYIIQLNEKIEHLQARVQELEQERRWIPVSERMPEEGQTILVCTRDRKIHEWLYSTALKSIFTRHVLYWKSKLMPVAPEGEEE